MKLLATRVDVSPDEVRLVGTVQRDRATATEEVFFAFPAGFRSSLTESADPFLPALLVPCLKGGEDLQFVPPVSPRLLSRLGRIQDILLCWNPDFRRVRVTARPRERQASATASGVAALFSGGVDSFYTLLRSLAGPASDVPRLTHLVFLKGLEQPLEMSRGVAESQQRAQEVAHEAGLTLIAGETNLRSRFSLNYELQYLGAAVAATTLPLSGVVGRLLVPSSNSYAQLVPQGSHPLLDELWSTEQLEILHHGAEATRVDKLSSLVARSPLALRYLRVCLENAGGPANCGRCRKCARTMLALELLGVRSEARTFPEAPRARLLRALRTDYDEYLDELLNLARSLQGEPALARLLGRESRRRRRRRALRLFMENTPYLSLSLPGIDRLRRRLRGRNIGLARGNAS
ncbi:MAG TPA: hypothetical protein VN461_03990 [Vicinamibacteria bacterium]|jgi:hypothetical protein|nr:hypothetical protein [Vicinamibacteria bacterium]